MHLSDAPQWFNLVLVGFFGLVALALALIGVCGAVSQNVARRTRELGIRLALGAQPTGILRLVVGEGAALAFIGIAIGVLAAFASAKLMKSLLFGVGATDPFTFLKVAVLLAFTALAACYLPARRALRVDPVTALRHD